MLAGSPLSGLLILRVERESTDILFDVGGLVERAGINTGSLSPPSRSVCARGRVVWVRQHPADQPGRRASQSFRSRRHISEDLGEAHAREGGEARCGLPSHSLQTPACSPATAPPVCLWTPGVVSVKLSKGKEHSPLASWGPLGY